MVQSYFFTARFAQDAKDTKKTLYRIVTKYQKSEIGGQRPEVGDQ